MSGYIITGKLGQGKTLSAVARIKEYLNQGRRVATNLDIKMENFKDSRNRDIDVIRVPDKPSKEDLDIIGKGHDLEYPDENRHGALVLDECGTWFNSRTWNDKSRQELINWFLHARKLRWDVYFVVQDQNIIDKQIRDTICEHVVFVRRMDKLRIPFLGKLTKMLGYEIRPPKIHLGIVKYGSTDQHPTVDKWWFRGVDVYDLYDTEQIYSDTQAGPYSYLTPWHIKGRYLQQTNRIDLANKHLMPIIRVLVLYPAYLYMKLTGQRASGGRCA